MTQTAALQKQQPPASLKSLLKDSIWQKRFEEILGKRAPQFVSSVLSVGSSLGSNCEPTSIIAAAMTAATLDLPVDKNLGFAWIVPYKGKGQFQMGYKGYIQLGLRTGQYERMNARVINEEAFQGWDEVGEPIIDWSQIDEAKPSIGYVFAFKLVNGFTKIAYWPKERVEAHAKRYSQSYGGKYSSPWDSNFDAMALKTVIKNELAKWGILSIEMVTAIKHDQGTQDGLGGDPHYLDGTDIDNIGNGKESKPDVITEEQRVALAAVAKASGADLAEIVKEAGFEMMAHITVDAYGDILAKASATPVAETPIPSIHTEPEDTDAGAEAALQESEEDEADEVVVDKDESNAEDLLADIKERLNALPARKSQELLNGRKVASMDLKQLKSFAKELSKAEAE